MDTPQRSVCWLESFPPDIWAYFAWYLPGEQLGRLKLTGSTYLWQRLKTPKVVKSIKLGQDFIVFTSWPRFLNEFPSLEELVIHSYDNRWSEKLGVTRDSIPSGVRKLELLGGWRGIFPNVFKESETLNLSKYLPHLETLNLRKASVDNHWETHSAQSLTKLSLFHWLGHDELPSSLIHFDAHAVFLSADSVVTKLPPNLESFEVTNQIVGIDFLLPLLPPSSRKLYLTSVDCCPKNFLELSPKSLTQLHIPNVAEINFQTNLDLISLLPSTLTILEMRQVLPCSVWHLLPQSLAKLAFMVPDPLCTVVSKMTDEHRVHHEVPSYPFDALPRSITKLQLWGEDANRYFCGPPAASNRSFFPPQLTHLEIPILQLSPETAKLLPSSLTYLEIGNLCERVCEHLPTGLRTLLAPIILITPNLIKFLPKSLASFTSTYPNPLHIWFDRKTGERVDSIAKLPEYTSHVDCMSNSFDWSGCAPLPSTLTYFDLTLVEELGDSFLLQQKLPNLLELNLGQAPHFTDLCMPLSSPHLQTLNLGESSKISGKSFEFLPKGLTFLDLSSSGSILDSDILHLPRTLEEANLNRATKLTDLCIPHLPPQLRRLSLRYNSAITPASLPYFPYPIRSSQAFMAAQFSKWYIHEGVVCQH